MAPNNILPSASYAPSANSFSSYRQQAQQHGPLRHTFSPEAGIGATPGSALGPVEPAKGQYFDRSELPARFKRTPLTEAEIEAIEQGGATSIW
jgi:small subunit ribosomal protein YMR-31